jgi:Fe-Mn family superoxide dismutase
VIAAAAAGMSVASAAASAQSAQAPAQAPAPAGPLELPPLPWPDNALAPHLSQETIQLHYGKHHEAYVDNANRIIARGEFGGRTLEEIVRTSAGRPDMRAIFNNAAQAWNHTFYWQSLSPKGGGQPSGKLLDRIKSDFGDFAKFKSDLAQAAVSQFGSGWAWVVLEDGKLKVVQTANADTPLANRAQKPLLTIDVWEHAYYVDYRNRRPDYVTAVLDKLVNWEFAAQNLG